LHQYGLKQKFVDIDRGTLNYDLNALADAITDKTRAIMMVNLLGNPNDFKRIKDIIGTRDIILIEDNCESLGARFEGRLAGTFGIAGSYSAFFSHHISTMEGGLVTTDDEELYHIMLSVRAHGWTRNLPKTNLVTGTKSDNAFEEAFRFVLPGYNLRPLEMSGALGQEQIRKLEMIVSERRHNAAGFKDVLAGYSALQPQVEIGESSWFGFSMVLDETSGVTRDQLVSALMAEKVETRPIVAGNFAKNEVVRKHMEHEIHGELTNADYIDRNGLFIGNHHFALDEQFEYLHRALRRVFNG
jgi:CDP-6-deoxy-D-xylo-4-hexulose-3-dehydrase